MHNVCCKNYILVIVGDDDGLGGTSVGAGVRIGDGFLVGEVLMLEMVLVMMLD